MMNTIILDVILILLLIYLILTENHIENFDDNKISVVIHNILKKMKLIKNNCIIKQLKC